MAKSAEPAKPKHPFLKAEDPVCLIIKATLKPVGDSDRFQPAGFPEIGHVIYDAPRSEKDGSYSKEKVCIVDSPASMANHLETVCLAGGGSLDLHPDLAKLPFVVCQTDGTDGNVPVVSTLTEGHRLASDYFLDATLNGTPFREQLRKDFKIVEVKKDKTYFIPPATWWDIYKTVFKYDPNSLVHGVMFAKEQIKISRLLTAHLEAFGASRVGRSGVKFDRLGKTTSGQPIFSVDEETANEIRATFIIDLALLRSYGRGENGLSEKQKQLLLDLSLWKVKQLLARPFRYRTQCFLGCVSVCIETESEMVDVAPPKPSQSTNTQTADTAATHDNDCKREPQEFLDKLPTLLDGVDIQVSIKKCEFEGTEPFRVNYPADQLYKAGKDDGDANSNDANDESNNDDEQES